MQTEMQRVQWLGVWEREVRLYERDAAFSDDYDDGSRCPASLNVCLRGQLVGLGANALATCFSLSVIFFFLDFGFFGYELFRWVGICSGELGGWDKSWGQGGKAAKVRQSPEVELTWRAGKKGQRRE